jgi:hypothetical protein
MLPAGCPAARKADRLLAHQAASGKLPQCNMEGATAMQPQRLKPSSSSSAHAITCWIESPRCSLASIVGIVPRW